MILQTDRLYLRQMRQTDYAALCRILQDAEVMYAYEHAFDDAETQAWLDRQRRRYREDGFGLWAAVLKQTGEMIGQCGITVQQCGADRVLEIGYLFQKAFWHQGYAIEAAAACKEYAFAKLNATEVFSIIRDTNIPSQNVAKRNGMVLRGQLIKRYYGVDMPHLIFSAKRDLQQ
ncbi:MAG: GNAT family N-acetyltransferase [Clostridiales bacterium]|nr:GNAT family N-acetyltransferase [Clostridiales bacterium]